MQSFALFFKLPPVPNLAQIVSYADEHLRIREIEDWPNALNGLQVENSGAVTKIGAAVDASLRTVQSAIERGVNFLIVHHGLFWPGLQPVSGGRRSLLEQIFQNDLALYSAHLPLDVHSVLGNNAQLADSLGLEDTKPFFEAKGQPIGLKIAARISRDELARKLEQSLGGPVRMFATGPAETESIGLITGGAGSEIYEVARDGIDTFITGEAPHWAAIAAEELGINLLLGGHYATETFGVKALAAHLSERFNLPWEFIDSPTGL
ncbi:MAG TPA: Nif3-like dinuclear metal center hexameric protein [Chthoniobacterales bacterium]|nr:Nif3-like dinuclear metal center hexameric protein [Chthoniobacterales bacterium]